MKRKSKIEQEREKLHPCIAHRGYSSLAPENTLAAFHLAVQFPYVHCIELDVQLSKDNVPIVIHDSILDRTSNKKGQVKNYTVKQLKELDVGSWFDDSFTGQRILTLDEVLKSIGKKCQLNIELKGEDVPAELIASKVIAIIKTNKQEKWHFITSFNKSILSAIHRQDARIRIGLLTSKKTSGLIKEVLTLGGSILSIAYSQLNQKLLQEAADAQVFVITWTANSPRELKSLVKQPHPFAICTNYPHRWLEAVKET